MRLCISLFSGLGGQHTAFLKEGWDVVSIDIERKFKPTIVADARYLPLREGLAPEILILAPPCNCFSVASIWKHWKDGVPGPEAVESIKLIRYLLDELLPSLKPKYWIMENPVGMLRTVIGRPRHTIRMSDYGARYKKPTDLWGNVPFKMLTETHAWEKAPRGSKCGLMAAEIRNPSERAKWPPGLSEAILDAITPEVVQA